MMSNVINWIKTNIVIVLSCLIMVMALGAFAWPIMPMESKIADEMEKRNRTMSTLTGYLRGTIELPIEGPTGAVDIRKPIREKDLKQLERIFEKMNSGYSKLFDDVIKFNQFGLVVNGKPFTPHTEMVPGLFPDCKINRFPAQTNYKRALESFFNSLNDGQNLPETGQPPTGFEIAQAQQAAEIDFRQNIVTVGGQLTVDQTIELQKKKLEAYRQLIVNRASRFKIYATPPRFPQTDTTSSSNDIKATFHIGAWALAKSTPEEDQLWEGQMNLWIQQDIVAAIRLANSVVPKGQSPSVLTCPIKRLISIEVPKAYVGVPPSGLGEVSTGDDGEVTIEEPEAETGGNTQAGFGKQSNTGRICNTLYDVRLAEVRLIADVARVPEILESFKRVNFMTPVLVTYKKVDPATEFLAGFYYGQNDIVQLDIKLESIWMRQWIAGQPPLEAIKAYQKAHPDDSNFNSWEQDKQITFLREKNLFNQGLMPDIIRFHLGIATLDPEFVKTLTDQGGNMFQGGDGGGGGGGGDFEQGGDIMPGDDMMMPR